MTLQSAPEESKQANYSEGPKNAESSRKETSLRGKGTHLSFFCTHFSPFTHEARAEGKAKELT